MEEALRDRNQWINQAPGERTGAAQCEYQAISTASRSGAGGRGTSDHCVSTGLPRI